MKRKKNELTGTGGVADPRLCAYCVSGGQPKSDVFLVRAVGVITVVF